jgi:hypothetical protein
VRTKRAVGIEGALLFVVFGLPLVLPVAASSASGPPIVTRQIAAGGTATLAARPPGADVVQHPELAAVPRANAPAAPNGASPLAPTIAGPVTSGKPEGQGSGVSFLTSFDGLNHRAQRLANGGNQFSVEPPDQGLCVGNGFVMESLNDVLNVYSQTGKSALGVVDLNTFYGYPAQIDRSTGVSGPFVTDPMCYFDSGTQRWFQTVLTLEVDGAGNFLGPNHLDVAVSNTGSPLGSWTIYRLPVQDDGSQGTPDHGCSLNPDGTGHGPCIGDYPKLGADANGFYIMTNEYSLFGPEFKASQIYAFSKRALASTAPLVTVTQIDTTGLAGGESGFTVVPAISANGDYAREHGGTEYFLSSDAAPDVTSRGLSDHIFLWALTNTRSLGRTQPDIALTNTALPVETYRPPPPASQKPGPFPLGQCINDTTLATPAGPGCWRILFAAEPAHTETEFHLDSSDSRMFQVTYSQGRVWGALGTSLSVGGAAQAGAAWYVVKPAGGGEAGGPASVLNQGQYGVPRNNVIYPTIGVTPDGRGVMAFTLTGADYYPSAAYAPIALDRGVGDFKVTGRGSGPEDGFSGYSAFAIPPGGAPRPRWGDYGATVVDGSRIWMASEYIGQRCSLKQWATAPIGSCGSTRTALANWDTRITEVAVSGSGEVNHG